MSKHLLMWIYACNHVSINSLSNPFYKGPLDSGVHHKRIYLHVVDAIH